MWIFWPYIIGSLNLAWLPWAAATYDFQAGGDFWASVRNVGTWALPVFDDALSVAGVVATILVATAATTGFSGDWSTVPERARAPLRGTLIVSLAILAAISFLTVPAVSADPGVLPRAILIGACGWLISFVGMSIIEVASPQQELVRLRKQLVARRIRAGRRTSDRASWPDALRLRAEIASWVIPAAIWLCIVVLPTLAQFSRTPYLPPALGLVIALFLLQMLIILGWRATADRSSSPAARAWIRALLALPAFIILIPAGVAVVGTPLHWLAWVTIGFSILLAATLYIAPVASRLPWVRVVEEASTTRGLRSATRAVERARARVGDIEATAASA